MARSRGEKGWAKRVVAQILRRSTASLWSRFRPTFGDGVRMIDPEVLNQILNLAGEHGPEQAAFSGGSVEYQNR